MAEPSDLDGPFAVEPIRRAAVFTRLSEGPGSRRELEAELGVSKATLHRIVTTFADAGMVRETDEGVTLTGAGRETAAAVDEYLDRMAQVRRLEPLLNGLPPELGFDIAAFAEAEVITPSPGHPQRPVQRVVDFVEAATSLRATAAVVLPIYVEVLSREVLAGMETELVVAPAVVEALTAEYPEQFARALDAGTLQMLVNKAIDIGVALDGERALLVVATGDSTQVAAVSDRPAAVEWVESVYETYRAEAVPYAPERRSA